MNEMQRIESLSVVDPSTSSTSGQTVGVIAQASNVPVIMSSRDNPAPVPVGMIQHPVTSTTAAPITAVAVQVPVSLNGASAVVTDLSKPGMPKLEDFYEQAKDHLYKSDRWSMDPANTAERQLWRLFYAFWIVLPFAIFMGLLEYRGGGGWNYGRWRTNCNWRDFSSVVTNVTNTTHWNNHFCIIDGLRITAQGISGLNETEGLSFDECKFECAERMERALRRERWDFPVAALYNEEDSGCYCITDEELDWKKCRTEELYSWQYQNCQMAQPVDFNVSCITYSNFTFLLMQRYGYGLDTSENWMSESFSCSRYYPFNDYYWSQGDGWYPYSR